MSLVFSENTYVVNMWINDIVKNKKLFKIKYLNMLKYA